MYIVMRGMCAMLGRVISGGKFFGEDMIITNPWLRNVSDAIALTFLQIVSLNREALFEVLPEFPVAYQVVRQAAYKLAFRRFIIAAAEAGIKAARPSDSPQATVFGQANAPSDAEVTRTRFQALRRPVNAVVDVEQAVAALKMKCASMEDAEQVLGARNKRTPFSDVSVTLFQSSQQQQSSKEEMARTITAMDARMSTMGNELGSVNAKLDAMQLQFIKVLTLLDSASQPLHKMRSKRNACAVAAVLSASPATGEEAAVGVRAMPPRHAGRHAERDEMREAFNVSDVPKDALVA